MPDPDPSSFESLLARARLAQARLDDGPSGPAEIGFEERVMTRVHSGSASQPALTWTGLWRILGGFAATAGAIACISMLSSGRGDAADDLTAFWSAGDRAWTLVLID